MRVLVVDDHAVVREGLKRVLALMEGPMHVGEASSAAEALKLVAGVGETIAGRLLILDAQSMRWRDVRVTRDPNCPVCSRS